MSAYRSIVVGTDGSTTAPRAMQRAAQVAREAQARLVIVPAYTPASREDVEGAEQALGDESFLVRGSAPAEENLRVAADAAKELGVQERQSSTIAQTSWSWEPRSEHAQVVGSWARSRRPRPAPPVRTSSSCTRRADGPWPSGRHRPARAIDGPRRPST